MLLAGRRQPELVRQQPTLTWAFHLLAVRAASGGGTGTSRARTFTWLIHLETKGTQMLANWDTDLILEPSVVLVGLNGRKLNGKLTAASVFSQAVREQRSRSRTFARVTEPILSAVLWGVNTCLGRFESAQHCPKVAQKPCQ